MRDITLIGRVVNDAQVKQTKNGRSYIEFRFANNEKRDPEGHTYWFRIASFQPDLINLKPWIVKGKPLFIQGQYSDRIYTTQAGVTEIGRDVSAHSIYFIDSGNKQENGTMQQQRESPSSGPIIPQVQAQPTIDVSMYQTTTTSSQVNIAADDDDDLPF